MTKRNRKKPIFCQGVAPTKERQHQNYSVIAEPIYEKNGFKTCIKRYRSTSECVIDYYRNHGKIDDAAYQAALLFRKDYLRAILHVKTDDNGSGSHGDIEMPMISLVASEKRLQDAYEVLSSSQKSIIIKICGHDEWAGDTYRFETFLRALAKLTKLWHLS